MLARVAKTLSEMVADESMSSLQIAGAKEAEAQILCHDERKH
jgi:hypothetical protein